MTNVEVVEMAHVPESCAENGPGQALRNARYVLRKSETEVAKQLNLSKDYIIALENDDYTKLPGMVFIRGYLRAYARVVNLPADDIIEQFNITHYASQTADAPQIMGTLLEQQAHHRDKSLRWIFYGVMIFFLVLVSVWWNNQIPGENKGTVQLSMLAEPESELVLGDEEVIP
jgi:cytoskeleton protein RodZ